jgi:hypothetical protein
MCAGLALRLCRRAKGLSLAFSFGPAATQVIAVHGQSAVAQRCGSTQGHRRRECSKFGLARTTAREGSGPPSAFAVAEKAHRDGCTSLVGARADEIVLYQAARRASVPATHVPDPGERHHISSTSRRASGNCYTL